MFRRHPNLPQKGLAANFSQKRQRQGACGTSVPPQSISALLRFRKSAGAARLKRDYRPARGIPGFNRTLLGPSLDREAHDGATANIAQANEEGLTVLTRAGMPQNHLSQIVYLLWVLALALVVAFFFFASSLCITILLSCFLAILVDPMIMFFERFRGV